MKNKGENAMITKQMISQGLKEGCVNLTVDPNMQSGTVCQIGEHWFYFGGLTAEELEPEEYLKHVPMEDIINSVFDALDSLKKVFSNEYKYYEYYLQENLPKKHTTALSGYEAYQLHWMIEHGYSIQQLMDALTEFQYDDPEDSDRISTPINELFAEWENDSGFNSEIWICEAEWNNCSD